MTARDTWWGWVSILVEELDGLNGLKFCQIHLVAFFNCSCTTALYCAKYVGQRRPNVFLIKCNAHGSLLSPKHPIAIAFYICARIPIHVTGSLDLASYTVASCWAVDRTAGVWPAGSLAPATEVKGTHTAPSRQRPFPPLRAMQASLDQSELFAKQRARAEEAEARAAAEREAAERARALQEAMEQQGWVEKYDRDSQRVYYSNERTGTTQWEHPYPNQLAVDDGQLLGQINASFSSAAAVQENSFLEGITDAEMPPSTPGSTPAAALAAQAARPTLRLELTPEATAKGALASAFLGAHQAQQSGVVATDLPIDAQQQVEKPRAQLSLAPGEGHPVCITTAIPPAAAPPLTSPGSTRPLMYALAPSIR
jgi:hypothetical protein